MDTGITGTEIAFITTPFQIIPLLLLIVCGLSWLSEQPIFRPLFRTLPLVIWLVLVPAALTGFNVIPRQLSIYEQLAHLCLPLSLFYLIASCRLRGLSDIGRKAGLALIIGVLGIVIGGLVVGLVFIPDGDESLWQGFAIIAAGWIGGTANGVAVQQGLQAPADTIAPLLLMQTLVGFLWLLLILSLGNYQNKINHWLGVNESEIPKNKTSKNDDNQTETSSNGLSLSQFSGLVALGISVLILAVGISSILPELGNPIIISNATWIILLIAAFGVIASASKRIVIAENEASNLGYLLLYIMLASLGTQLDFSVLSSVWVFVKSGLLWLLVHAIVVIILGRLFKLPIAYLAIGSIANVGGIVTSPLVASYYNRNLVPIALLMAVVTQIIGVYIPFALAAVFSQLANIAG
jgi:uncharacterized membrane protein